MMPTSAAAPNASAPATCRFSREGSGRVAGGGQEKGRTPGAGGCPAFQARTQGYQGGAGAFLASLYDQWKTRGGHKSSTPLSAFPSALPRGGTAATVSLRKRQAEQSLRTHRGCAPACPPGAGQLTILNSVPICWA